MCLPVPWAHTQVHPYRRHVTSLNANRYNTGDMLIIQLKAATCLFVSLRAFLVGRASRLSIRMTGEMKLSQNSFLSRDWEMDGL